MPRTVYRVMPAGKNWELREGDRVVSSDERKEQVVQHARQVAREHRPSQLVIHSGDGRIEDESTYQDDPYPPVG